MRLLLLALFSFFAGAGAPVVLVHGFTANVERAWLETGMVDNLARAHAVGYSLGGIILAKLLTTHPERFTSAVLGGAAYRRSQSAQADQAADAAAREIELGIYRALVVTDAEIAKVRVPALAVVGEADPALPRVRAMMNRWPGLEVEVVPGAAHPTVHARGLPRNPQFAAAVRRHIAARP
jgi:pimeloyl-ACP methyl ester carboxylesterase